jgi:hypothetical protein
MSPRLQRPAVDGPHYLDCTPRREDGINQLNEQNARDQQQQKPSRGWAFAVRAVIAIGQASGRVLRGFKPAPRR